MSLDVINYENVSEWPIAEDNVLVDWCERRGGAPVVWLFIILQTNKNMSWSLDHFETEPPIRIKKIKELRDIYVGFSNRAQKICIEQISDGDKFGKLPIWNNCWSLVSQILKFFSLMRIANWDEAAVSVTPFLQRAKLAQFSLPAGALIAIRATAVLSIGRSAGSYWSYIITVTIVVHVKTRAINTFQGESKHGL